MGDALRIEAGTEVRRVRPILLWVGQPPSEATRESLSAWKLVFANDSDETIRALSWNRVDILVSDQPLSDTEELSWIEGLRSKGLCLSIPVVILTEGRDPSLKRRALELGATDLLPKPVADDELIARLDSLLRLKRTQDELEKKNSELEAIVSERTRQLEESRLEVVWRLSKAAETRDVETGNHTLRVGFYSQVTARSLGLSKQYQEKLLLAAPLHDIGKLGIPDVILQKNGPLTKSEFEVMKTHTTIGNEILMASYSPPKSYKLDFGDRRVSRSPFIELAATIALQHHEKWNGMGYPHGIASTEIDLGARIVAVADAFDAIRSERPYKRAAPEHEAVRILRESAGEHFDQDVVDAFLDSLQAIRSIGSDLADDEFRMAA